MQVSFTLKGEGECLVVANFLLPESFVLVATRVGLGAKFLKASKTNVIFCYATF